MKDITKLVSLESLLTKNGKLNAAMTRQIWF
jgi:very-short-patch-repair endonuclease